MANITPLDINAADHKTAETLNAVKGKIGMIPNLFSTFALAPTVLNAYLHFSSQLESGRLSARQREMIALTVAQINACGYCLSAHTTIGKGAGLSEEDIYSARIAKAHTAIDQAVVTVAEKIVNAKGQLAPAELKEARDAGVDDALLVEIIANVALNILTNYTNVIADTDVDFPIVNVAL